MLVPLDVRGADRGTLIDFMTSHEFPFHVGARPTRAEVEARLEHGDYDDEDHQAFWVDVLPDGASAGDTPRRVGLVVLEDLTDDAPLFDLRLATRERGHGLGAVVLRAIVDHVFRTMSRVNRLEGQTREDNIAMRKTFLRAGFVKEAHYREGWPVSGGEPLASVAYGILRKDWETGTTTRFVWEDLA